MLPGNIFPNSVRNSGIKSLLSNHNMLSFFKKFCDEVTSRTWRFKKGKNSRYEEEEFLKVFFFLELLGRSIHDTSELLNAHLMSNRGGRPKIFADGRRKRARYLTKQKSTSISARLDLGKRRRSYVGAWMGSSWMP